MSLPMMDTAKWNANSLQTRGAAETKSRPNVDSALALWYGPVVGLSAPR
jgi:hypothetical protein